LRHSDAYTVHRVITVIHTIAPAKMDEIKLRFSRTVFHISQSGQAHLSRQPDIASNTVTILSQRTHIMCFGNISYDFFSQNLLCHDLSFRARTRTTVHTTSHTLSSAVNGWAALTTSLLIYRHYNFCASQIGGNVDITVPLEV